MAVVTSATSNVVHLRRLLLRFSSTQCRTQEHLIPLPPPLLHLSSLPPSLTVKATSSILRSLIHLRPRSLSQPILSSLLEILLPTPNFRPLIPTVYLPLVLAVIQSYFRSGLTPPPDTPASLTNLWVHIRCRHHRVPVSRLLSLVNDLGYNLDGNTCNFLIGALCRAEEVKVEEAVGVLRGMRVAGCFPDSESYWKVIGKCCTVGRVGLAEDLMKFVVVEEGMVLKRGMVARMVKAMRTVGEVRRAVEMVRFLEKEGCDVEFDGYECLLEGCLEVGEFVLAGKVVVEMTRRGYVPFVEVRRRAVEGLAGIGQHELAGEVRRCLSDIGS